MKWFIYNLIGAMMLVYLIEWIIDLQFTQPLVFLPVYIGSYLLIWLASWFFNRRYFHRLPILISFIGYIIRELLESNFRVAYDVLTKEPLMNPGVLALPLDVTSDREIVTLAILITFTPGTLSMAISDDRRTLYVHVMYIPNNDIEEVKRKLKNGFERRLIELTRP